MTDPIWKKKAPPEIEKYRDEPGYAKGRCDGCTAEHLWLVHVGAVRQWDADGAARLCLKCLRQALTLGVEYAKSLASPHEGGDT